MKLLIGSYNKGLYQILINTNTNKFENLIKLNDKIKTSYLVNNDVFAYLYTENQKQYIEIDNTTVLLNHGASHLAYFKEQEAMLISFYGDGLFKVLRKRPNWKISEQFSFPKGSHIHYSNYIPTVNLIGLVDLGLDKIYFYHNNKPLSLYQTYTFDQHYGPRHFVNNLSEPIIYVLSELIPYVFVLKYIDNKWHEIARYQLENGAGSAIRITNDNKHLFAAVRDINKIYHFNILTDGTLKLVNSYDTFGDHPRDFNVFEDKYIVIANMKSDNLTLYLLENNQLILKDSNFKLNAGAAIICK